MKTFLFFLISIFLFFACSDNDSDEMCYSFDERQCQTDLWAEGLPSGASIEDRRNAIVGYFLDNEIIVKEIFVDPAFHEVVCAACDVCPLGPRFYIRAEEVTMKDLEPFGLLSLQVADCQDIF